MPALLSVNNASKQFGKLVAVDDVSFEVNQGEIYGIAGPNGAGKTTLFNLITGIPYHGDSGNLYFRDRLISGMSPHRIFRLGIARTFQKETAFDTLTVEQNVRIGAVYGGIHGEKEALEAVDRILHDLDLDQERQRIASELSLYAKKRLMIASAVISNPTILMLDEPAGGLNVAELGELEQLIRALLKRNITIIIIEHVLPLLFGISHRVMVMDFGRRLAEGPPEQLAKDDTVIEAYLGDRGKDAFHAITG